MRQILVTMASMMLAATTAAAGEVAMEVEVDKAVMKNDGLLIVVTGELEITNGTEEAITFSQSGLKTVMRVKGKKEPVAKSVKPQKGLADTLQIAAGEEYETDFEITLEATDGLKLTTEEEYTLVVRSGKVSARVKGVELSREE